MAKSATNKAAAGARLTTPSQRPGATLRQTGAAARPPGASFTMTGAANRTGSSGTQRTAPSTPGAPPKPPDNSGTVAPFLTADQQTQELKDYQAYQQNLATWQEQLAEAPGNEAAAEAQENYKAAVATANQNALDAARGLFSSGINASALGDINTTLNTNLLTLQTNLSNLQHQLQGEIGTAGTNWNTESDTYAGIAAANAAGQTPPSASTPSSTGSPNPAPGATPPVPTGPPRTQPQTTHPNPAPTAPRAPTHTTGAALTTPSQHPNIGAQFRQTGAVAGPNPRNAGAALTMMRQGW